MVQLSTVEAILLDLAVAVKFVAVAAKLIVYLGLPVVVKPMAPSELPYVSNSALYAS